MNLYLRFLRIVFKIFFSQKKNPLDISRLDFRAWPHDCDIYFHMTNSRYPAMMDLGRTFLLGQARVIGKILKNKFLLVPVSSEISYIREIKPFQKFTLHTRLIYWDDTYWYVEQRFQSDHTLHTVATIRGLTLKKGKKVPFQEILDLYDEPVQKLEMPERIRAWQNLLEEKKKVTNHISVKVDSN